MVFIIVPPGKGHIRHREHAWRACMESKPGMKCKIEIMQWKKEEWQAPISITGACITVLISELLRGRHPVYWQIAVCQPD